MASPITLAPPLAGTAFPPRYNRKHSRPSARMPTRRAHLDAYREALAADDGGGWPFEAAIVAAIEAVLDLAPAL
jgi:hypothetical protein